MSLVINTTTLKNNKTKLDNEKYYFSNKKSTFQSSSYGYGGNINSMLTKIYNSYNDIAQNIGQVSEFINDYATDVEGYENSISDRGNASIKAPDVGRLSKHYVNQVEKANLDEADLFNVVKYQGSSANSTNSVQSALASFTKSMSLFGKDAVKDLAGAAEVVGSTVASWTSAVADTAGKVLATGAVAANSVASGVGKLVEYVDDGTSFLSGAVASGILGIGDLFMGTNNAKKNMDNTLDEIRRDKVAEINQNFYENTWLGRVINENSYMKYDSKEAQTIVDVSEFAAKFAAATAATVATGGAAAPAVVGVLYGAGKSLENYTQTVDRAAGEEYSSVKVTLNAGIGAVTGAMDWAATGKLGSGFLEIGKLASTIGLKETGAQVVKDITSKEFITKMLKEGLASKNAFMNYLSSAMMVSNDAAQYATGKKEFNLGEGLKLGGKFILCLAANVLEDGARDYVGNFTMSQDNALKLAQEILDNNNSRTLEDITKLNNENIRLITDAMSPEEIAKGMETLSKEDYQKIMSSLSKNDRLNVIFAQGQLAAQGKYNGFFVNFREHAGAHTANVRDYAVEIANTLDNVNIDEVYYGAQFHDLGMRGGLFKDKAGNYLEIDSLTKENNLKIDDLEEYILTSRGYAPKDSVSLQAIMKNEFGIEDWANNKSISLLPEDITDAAFSNYVANLARKNHPLNSAIIILTEDVVPDGVDKDVVALLAMSHSKSTSGIQDFSNPSQWNHCVDDLGRALLTAGMDEKDVAKTTEHLKKLIGDGTSESFKRLVDEALCIRDGDAMSALALTSKGDTIMQTGDYTHVIPRLLLSDDEVPTSMNDEISTIQDLFYTKDGTPIMNADGTQKQVMNTFSKKTHAGEKNIVFDSAYDGKMYDATAVITDPYKAPYSTLDSAYERIGEVITYQNCDSREFEFVIDINKDSKLADWYSGEINHYLQKTGNKNAEKIVEEIAKQTGADSESLMPVITSIFNKNGSTSSYNEIVNSLGNYTLKDTDRIKEMCESHSRLIDFLQNGVKITFSS